MDLGGSLEVFCVANLVRLCAGQGRKEGKRRQDTPEKLLWSLVHICKGFEFKCNALNHSSAHHCYHKGWIQEMTLDVFTSRISSGSMTTFMCICPSMVVPCPFFPISRGLVLELVLFNIFVGNEDNEIECTLSTFANATKLCDAVSMLVGRGCYPEGPGWTCANLMRFQKAKCKVLQLGWGNPKPKYIHLTAASHSQCIKGAAEQLGKGSVSGGAVTGQEVMALKWKRLDLD